MYIRHSLCFYWMLCYSKNRISIIQFRGYQYYWRGPDTKTRPHVCRQPCSLCEHPNEQATVAGGDGHTVEAENISILHVNVPCHTRLKCTPPLSAVTLWEWEERKKCFILGFHRLSSLWCMFNRRGLGWWSSFFSTSIWLWQYLYCTQPFYIRWGWIVEFVVNLTESVLISVSEQEEGCNLRWLGSWQWLW